jgi:hypothetical protein
MKRKARKAALKGITPEEMAARSLRFAAIEMNRHVGPDETAWRLEHLAHLFYMPGEFREVAVAVWQKEREVT